MCNIKGVQLVKTVTVAASGAHLLSPSLSNCPFKNLNIIIKPLGEDIRYQVDVFFFGELAETHTYPLAGDKVICHMTFPDLLFPANMGTATQPMYFNPNGLSPEGLPVSFTITNMEVVDREFEVYVVFEQFDPAIFGVLNIKD